MWGLAGRMMRSGVLGINRRNAVYVLIYNQRRFYPLVDNKLLTKRRAEAAGLATPALYAVVESPASVRGMRSVLSNHRDFVVKPAHGSGGNGILVVTDQDDRHLHLAQGMNIDWAEFEFHVHNILAGTFSLGGQPDKAMVEYRVRFDPVFEHIAYKGVPDIRIIVFLGVPVMAMVRLPTRQSSGRANLHQGAIGVGIDIATGRTLGGVWKDREIFEHPDTGVGVGGLQIPGWDKLLEVAAGSCELTGLGYQGIDIVLDADLGPLILELNARPGLAIQIANRTGLRRRLEFVQAHRHDLESVDDRVGFAKAAFGSQP